jgi:hypothetical protein
MSNEELKIDIILDEIDYKGYLKNLSISTGVIEHIISSEEEKYVMRHPIGFKSRDGKVSGKIDFGIMIKHEIIDRKVRNLTLSHLESSVLTDFKCSGDESWCS